MLIEQRGDSLFNSFEVVRFFRCQPTVQNEPTDQPFNRAPFGPYLARDLFIGVALALQRLALGLVGASGRLNSFQSFVAAARFQPLGGLLQPLLPRAGVDAGGGDTEIGEADVGEREHTPL